MALDDLTKLANAILDANSEAEMYRLLAPLTAEATEACRDGWREVGQNLS
jgi:hypothetical protein